MYNKAMKTLAQNKKARFDYSIEDTLVAGIELLGPEVKSIKAGQISLKGSFINLRGGEAYLTNAHVNPYAFASSDVAHEPLRSRKLLLKASQLIELQDKKNAGSSIVALSIGLNRNLIKVTIGIGRGKKNYDKRDSIKEREQSRELARKFRR